MIQYKKGNLLNDEAAVLVNTVNLVGVMGKGIALAFKQAFPYNFEEYAKACKSRTLGIGGFCVVKDYHMFYGHKTIVNMPTKIHWHNPSEYDYIRLGLDAFKEFILTANIENAAIPALGCGNGGLDWQRVKLMIEKQLEGLDSTITVYMPRI